jgi:four helix bundle protein
VFSVKNHNLRSKKWEEGKMVKFRFQDLEIWKKSIEISDGIFDISDTLEKRHLYRFAEQLRGSCLSVSNNIAEGSGSISRKEFVQFLNFSRRSIFETANIIIILNKRKIINEDICNKLLTDIDCLSRQVTNFQKTLKASK